MVEKQRKLEARIQDLTDLIGVARVVVSSLELDQVLERILSSAIEFMGMKSGTLAVYNESAGAMQLHASSGLSERFLNQESWPIQGRGDLLTREAMVDFSIKYGSSSSGMMEGGEFYLDEGIKSVICIPLASHNRPVGVLHLYDRKLREIDDSHLEHLSVISSFAAMAIDNASLHKRTKLMALTDALTGLYNNRYFMQVFPHELVRARRYMKPLSIIMIDVDNFKKLNDTYGHPKGDQVLAAVGNVLSGALRAADFSFRYGGEEFTILLPETRIEGAFMVAETLREKIAAASTPLLGRSAATSVTVSLGVANYPSDGTTTEQLLAHADACLYKAKRQGKDRVHWQSIYS